jgi:hypothetical protein
VTAGPTFEAIDPVRGITNLSSGKMGFAIARAAHEAGAQVTLVAGPVSLPTPRGVARRDVKSAQDMLKIAVDTAQAANIFIATAAVADWRPAVAATQKIKKDGSGQTPTLAFTENPDILATIAHSPRATSGALFCVGFAAESENLLEHAKAKRARKGGPGDFWARRQCAAAGGCTGRARAAACQQTASGAATGGRDCAAQKCLKILKAFFERRGRKGYAKGAKKYALTPALSQGQREFKPVCANALHLT